MSKIIVEISDEALVDVAVESINEQVVNRVVSLLEDKKFIDYVAERLSNALFYIAVEETTTIDNNAISDSEINDYLSGFGVEIRDNTISLFNSSIIDTSTKNISLEKRGKYPLELSLSKLIEYGFGYTGWSSTEILPQSWEYDVNNHGYKGWYYVDNAGNVHWTNGMEGRLVFLKLCWWIEEKFGEIIAKYLKSNL